MKTPEEIFEILKNQFGEDNIAINSELPTEPIINVHPSKIEEVYYWR